MQTPEPAITLDPKLIEPDSLGRFRHETFLQNGEPHTTLMHVFKSWQDFLSDVFETATRLPASSSRGTYKKDWQGIDGDIKDVRRAVELGWDDGERLFKAIQSSLPKNLYEKIVPPMDYAKEWSPSLDTGSLDIARYLGGEAECFITEKSNLHEIKAGNKLVTLVYNCAQSCSNKPEILALAGTVVYGLVEHLESVGFSTQVVVVFPVSLSNLKGRPDYQLEVPIKQFGDMFDRHKMLVSIVAPFMLRVMGFSAADLVPSAKAREEFFSRDKSYGFPASAISRGGLLFEVINPGAFNEVVEKFSKLIKKHVEELTTNEEKGD